MQGLSAVGGTMRPSVARRAGAYVEGTCRSFSEASSASCRKETGRRKQACAAHIALDEGRAKSQRGAREPCAAARAASTHSPFHDTWLAGCPISPLNQISPISPLNQNSPISPISPITFPSAQSAQSLSRESRGQADTTCVPLLSPTLLPWTV